MCIKGQLIEYHQFYSYLNTLNSGLDHQNLNLNLKEVVSVYSNFTPSTWASSYSYDGFSTPKIMNAGNVETDLQMVADKIKTLSGCVWFGCPTILYNVSHSSKDNILSGSQVVEQISPVLSKSLHSAAAYLLFSFVVQKSTN